MVEREILLFQSTADYERWLETDGEKSPGFWMKIAKPGAEISTINYQQALEVSLCYGWIDGQKRKLDSTYWLQGFSARRPRSLWSKINTEKAERLIAEGKMRPSGLKAVLDAKADGRWERAYQAAGSHFVPPDLQTALEHSPHAHSFFQQLDSQNRYAFVFRIQNTKKPETRAAKVQKFVEMLENKQVFYPKTAIS